MVGCLYMKESTLNHPSAGPVGRLKLRSGAMARCLLILSLYIAATNARNNATLHVVAPVHAAVANASIEVMLNWCAAGVPPLHLRRGDGVGVTTRHSPNSRAAS